MEKKDLLDDTVIVLFGDHNAYYQGLSSYVKDIENYDTERKFTDLYNVPLMIYDTDLTAKIAENKDERMIHKFTCTADIVPTLLDLLGVRYYTNLYYGQSYHIRPSEPNPHIPLLCFLLQKHCSRGALLFSSKMV